MFGRTRAVHTCMPSGWPFRSLYATSMP